MVRYLDPFNPLQFGIISIGSTSNYVVGFPDPVPFSVNSSPKPSHSLSPRLPIILKILKIAQKLNETPVNMSKNRPKSFQLNDSSSRNPDKNIKKTSDMTAEVPIIPILVRCLENLNIKKTMNEL
jgi:hypothetical protein